jgi:hypothetical protein
MRSGWRDVLRQEWPRIVIASVILALAGYLFVYLWLGAAVLWPPKQQLQLQLQQDLNQSFGVSGFGPITNLTKGESHIMIRRLAATLAAALLLLGVVPQLKASSQCNFYPGTLCDVILYPTYSIVQTDPNNIVINGVLTGVSVNLYTGGENYNGEPETLNASASAIVFQNLTTGLYTDYPLTGTLTRSPGTWYLTNAIVVSGTFQGGSVTLSIIKTTRGRYSTWALSNTPGSSSFTLN